MTIISFESTDSFDLAFGYRHGPRVICAKTGPKWLGHKALANLRMIDADVINKSEIPVETTIFLKRS